MQQTVEVKDGSEDSKEVNQVDKRTKLEDSLSDRKLRETSVPVTAAVDKPSPPPRCVQCRQLLDDPDLKMFPGDPCDAVRLAYVFNCLS